MYILFFWQQRGEPRFIPHLAHFVVPSLQHLAESFISPHFGHNVTSLPGGILQQPGEPSFKPHFGHFFAPGTQHSAEPFRSPHNPQSMMGDGAPADFSLETAVLLSCPSSQPETIKQAIKATATSKNPAFAMIFSR